MKAETKIRKNSSLINRAYRYFLLLFFVSFSLSIVIIYVAAVPNLDEQVLKALSGVSSDQTTIQKATSDIVSTFKQLQYKIFWVILVCLAGNAILFFLMIRNMVSRLEDVTKIADKIAKGHLNEAVPIYQYDEIGIIGRVVNEVVVNLQEILLLLWNQAQNCLGYLDHLDGKNEKNNKTSNNLDERLQQMRHSLEDMQTMIRSFDFYGVYFEDGKLVTRQEQTQSSSIPNRRHS
jgi:methyl-accepting chemotaxis protein